MKRETAERIYNKMEKIEENSICAILLILLLIALPFWSIYDGIKYIRHKIKREVFDSKTKKWRTKEEIEKDILIEKMENREIPLVVENHITPHKDDSFYFFKKRKWIIPSDKLVYVECEYNQKIHQFFDNNAEWLESWQRWHGFEIIEANYDDIKEGMFFPEDFSVFKHGFLWPSSSSSWYKEIYGNIHYYYEIDPDSIIPIKKQMELFMRKIYEEIDWT